jgi:phage tail-like protein
MARTDPADLIAKFRFGVEIQGVVVGWFTECGDLSLEREVIPLKEGGVNDYVHQLPSRVSYSAITLKRGLADNVLWDWFQKGLYDGKVELHNVSIVLYGGDRAETRRWNLVDAYPVKWTGPELKGDSDDLAVETLEIGCGGGGGGASVQRAESEGVVGIGQAAPSTQAEEPVDLPALAAKVVGLLRRDLQLERERLGWNRP